MTVFLASFALPFLFCASAAMAVAALGLTWRAYYGELRMLRAQLEATPDEREFTARLATVQVREFNSAKRRSAIRARAAAPARRAPGQRAVA